MNRHLLLSISLVLASGLAAEETVSNKPVSQASDPAYDVRCVGKIDVKIENLPEGSSFDRSTVVSRLKTKQGDPFSQYVFDQDLKQLAKDYDRVEPQVNVEDGVVDITLKVWIRPIISKILIEGNQYIKSRILKRELDVQPGTVFNRAEFNKGLSKIKEYYIKKGYFESQFNYRLITNEKTGEVEVVITIDEGRSGKVEDIRFSGLTSREESDIIEKLYTKKYSNLLSWFTGSGKFIEEALEQDRLTIFNYLQDLGYADARVNINITESNKKGKIIIDISAEKGVLYRFGQVSFDGNILFSDEEVERIFSARPEGVYSPDKLRKTTEAIKDLYGRKGFIDTSVTYETQLVQNAPIYNVHFRVSEGREYRIGMIRIIGNVQTEDRVLLRESLLVPGETFDSLKLKVTQSRIERMGYFKSVNVYAVRTQDDVALGENYRDIYIEVEEQQTGNISLSGGFSSADNLFGSLDLIEKNFNYRGLADIPSDGLSAIRGGGEFLHLRATFGSKAKNYMVSWVNPYLNDTKWRLGFEFSASIQNELIAENFDINTYNFNSTLSYPLSPYFSYGFKYRVRNYRIDLDKRLRRAASENESKNENSKDRHQDGILSGLGMIFVFDTTNSAVNPTRGFRSSLDAEVTGLGGNTSFFRTGFANAYYTPLWRKGYMRYRMDWRFLVPFGWTDDYNEIPLSERFFLGGVASVRGYKDFSIGPHFDIGKQTTSGVEIEKNAEDPAGGISSSFLSIEYNQTIFPFLQGFLFMDAGYISEEVFGFGTYRMSYGVGFNIDVMGRIPVTIGWGFPVNAQEGTKIKNHFFFSLGGQF